MSISDESRDELVEATRALAGKVEDLSNRVTISHRQTQRNRLLTRMALVVTVVCLAAIVVTGVLIGQVHQATVSNKAAQVTTCLSANESRAANLKLWTFLIGQSTAETHQEQVALDLLETWIGKLYAPHDCSDLNKPFHVPPPPQLGLK